jgi:hypothetical protein
VPLALDAQTLPLLFLGNVTKWNDARLVALNPMLASCDGTILACFDLNPSIYLHGSGLILCLFFSSPIFSSSFILFFLLVFLLPYFFPPVSFFVRFSLPFYLQSNFKTGIH